MSMGIVDLVGRGLGCERSGIVSLFGRSLHLPQAMLRWSFSGQKGRAPGQTPQGGRSSSLLYRWFIFDHFINQ